MIQNHAKVKSSSEAIGVLSPYCNSKSCDSLSESAGQIEEYPEGAESKQLVK